MNLSPIPNAAAFRKDTGTLLQKMVKQRYLMLLSMPFVLWIILFDFIPTYGYYMAFVDYNPNMGVFGSPWVGLKHFIMFFQNDNAFLIIRNTVCISFMGIIARLIFPLIFALMINEVKNVLYKRVIQTFSYLPHFVSFVVVANLFLTLLSMDGPVNTLLMASGLIQAPVKFWWNPNLFWVMITSVDVWKEIGWGAIIYLAAISGIDEELYEAAKVDGCKKFRRMWHITIPSILPTAVVLLVMSMGGIFKAGFQQSYLFGNPATKDVAEVISTYVFRYGIGMGMFSFTTAISIMQVLIGFLMVFLSNRLAKRLTEYSLW